MNLVIGCDALLIEQSKLIAEQSNALGLEFDGSARSSQYAILYDGMLPIGTARLTLHGKCVIINQLAMITKYQADEQVHFLLESLIKYVRRQGITRLEAHTTDEAQAYYQNVGFEFVEQVDVVGHFRLSHMRLWIQKRELCQSP